MNDRITMDHGDHDWLQSIADVDNLDNILSIGRATRIANRILELESERNLLSSELCNSESCVSIHLDRIAELSREVRNGQASKYLLEDNIKLNSKICDLEAQIAADKPCPFTLGWAYADACVMVDEGIDIRKIELPEIMERAERDFAG